MLVVPTLGVVTITRLPNLLSERDRLLSRFCLQLRPVSFADVLGFIAFRREFGVGLLGVGFE